MNAVLKAAPIPLSGRRMQDSFCRAILPLSSSKVLRDNYVNFLGQVRFGLVLEDLDTFAVWVSYKHQQCGEEVGAEGPLVHSPVALFTACVDRISVLEVVSSDRDIVFEGNVTWVGSSSLEVTVNVLQSSESNGWSLVLIAKFVMVARDPLTSKGMLVHPLEVSHDDAEEAALCRLGEENKKIRHLQSQLSLFKTHPNEEESKLLHELFLTTIDERSRSFRSRRLPERTVWMDSCKLKNLIICHPQRRNLYNKIFGGYLMRNAFELAWANACVFSRKHPRILAVDDIVFRKSVDVGSLLYLSSEMCYTNDSCMQVRVHADVADLSTGAQETTNTFYFSFETADKSQVLRVMPNSYADGMLYLSGRRHFNDAMAERRALLRSN